MLPQILCLAQAAHSFAIFVHCLLPLSERLGVLRPHLDIFGDHGLALSLKLLPCATTAPHHTFCLTQFTTSTGLLDGCEHKATADRYRDRAQLKVHLSSNIKDTVDLQGRVQRSEMSNVTNPKTVWNTPKKRPKSAVSVDTTPPSKPDTISVDSEITVISHFADIVLDVSREGTKEHVLVKVDSSKLKNVSKYFKALLDPNGFLEGNSILQQQERLQEIYSKSSDIPDEDLPRIKITDIGQTSALKSIKPLVVDFLRILHGYDIQRALKNPPPVNIANLAVLADRFDAKDSVSTWAQSKPNVLPKIHAALPIYDEEIYRQRLLTCLFLGNETRLATYSSHLILQGSVMWRNQVPQENSAMWWDLPRGVEGASKIVAHAVQVTDYMHRGATITPWIHHRDNSVIARLSTRSVHIQNSSVQTRLRLISAM